MKAALTGILIVALAVILGVRAWIGPFHLDLAVNSPVNAQCLVGLIVTLAVVGGAGKSGH